jgi:hypothetical protein
MSDGLREAKAAKLAVVRVAPCKRVRGREREREGEREGERQTGEQQYGLDMTHMSDGLREAKAAKLAVVRGSPCKRERGRGHTEAETPLPSNHP